MQHVLKRLIFNYTWLLWSFTELSIHGHSECQRKWCLCINVELLISLITWFRCMLWWKLIPTTSWDVLGTSGIMKEEDGNTNRGRNSPFVSHEDISGWRGTPENEEICRMLFGDINFTCSRNKTFWFILNNLQAKKQTLKKTY